MWCRTGTALEKWQTRSRVVLVASVSVSLGLELIWFSWWNYSLIMNCHVINYYVINCDCVTLWGEVWICFRIAWWLATDSTQSRIKWLLRNEWMNFSLQCVVLINVPISSEYDCNLQKTHYNKVGQKSDRTGVFVCHFCSQKMLDFVVGFFHNLWCNFFFFAEN